MKGSLFSSGSEALEAGAANSDNRLYTLVCELARLVDTQRSRLDLVDEEALHFKQSFESMSREYERIKT